MEDLLDALTAYFTKGSIVGSASMTLSLPNENMKADAALFFKVRKALGVEGYQTADEARDAIAKTLQALAGEANAPNQPLPRGMTTQILSNQVKCGKCGDTPFSAHRHDFKACKCGAISVDGGMDYLRRVGDIHGCEDMSIEIPKAAADAARDKIVWAQDTGRTPLGVLCAVAIGLRDHGVDLVTRAITDRAE